MTRLTRFQVGETVILPDGQRVRVLMGGDDQEPYWISGGPVLVPCVRTTVVPGLRTPIVHGGSCSGHADCRAAWFRRSEWGRRNAAARGKAVRPKSRAR